ncbi:MAG: 3',5'-cyclic-nucleotide phosphodiesterase [Planctomycetes bacterium]|nr:3',5'-cyclic-nucleotide phosphodiesterase [Planctomycetota bacterium]
METTRPIQLRVLGCCGGASPGRGPTSFILDGNVAVDAGSLASALPLDEQAAIRHVLITHPHLDHLRELPLFLDNTYGASGEPVLVHALEPVLEALRLHVFNGVLWPDLSRLSPPPALFREVRAERSFAAADLEVTPFASCHGSPAAGYAFRRIAPPASAPRGPALAVATDTGYDDALFERIAELPALGALVVEASFPDRLGDLADRSYHLTPDRLERGLRIVRAAHAGMKVLVTHLKPAYRDEITGELRRLEPPVVILEDGDTFEIA